MKINFSFNKIYIIESLFSGEIKTGENIYNDLIRWKTLNTAPLHSEFVEASSKKSFIQIMSRINHDIKKGFSPFIHFEIHGSSEKNGFVLNSRELVSWEELAQLTRFINVATNNNLIISLATCYGAYFITSIDINKVAPFSCCVSTIETITSEEVTADFTLFFETILSSTDFNLAVEQININNKKRDKYHFFSAEEFLEMLLKRMEDEDFNFDSITNRNWVNSLTKRLRILSPEYAELKKKKVKEIVRNQILTQKSSLRSSLRESFLTFSS